MSQYDDVLELRQKILSQLRQTKSLTQLQSDGIIMSSDLWLSQERIEDEFDSETWHYLLMIEIVDLISYLNLELSAYEESLKQFV